MAITDAGFEHPSEGLLTCFFELLLTNGFSNGVQVIELFGVSCPVFRDFRDSWCFKKPLAVFGVEIKR